MKNKKVYILLTDTGTVFTRMIKLYTKSSLNHASIAFDEELEELYSFGRKSQTNPFIGGFVKENIQTELFKGAKCAVYSCSVTEFEFYQLKRKIKSIEQRKEDYKYNLIGLFGVVLNIEIERENAFFCSQFVATLLNESGVSIVDKPLSLVTPQDLIEAKQLNLEYEGDLDSYPFVKCNQSKTTKNLYFDNTYNYMLD
ncbi:MAG: hypothetical protein ACQEWV_18130 [Bacillota bacterium]